MYINIYSDGACSNNPGPGGYACIITQIDDSGDIMNEVAYVSGNEKTTNNRMELMGVIRGLQEIKRLGIKNVDVNVYTDSSYVANAFNQNWIRNWQRNDWKKSDGNPVLNELLWKTLVELVYNSTYEVKFNWIKGHAGNPYNERCDELAVNYYKENFISHEHNDKHNKV